MENLATKRSKGKYHGIGVPQSRDMGITSQVLDGGVTRVPNRITFVKLSVRRLIL